MLKQQYNNSIIKFLKIINMLFESVSLSLKKKFFFINLLQELVVMFSFTKTNKFYTSFAKKKFYLNYNYPPNICFYKIISSSLLNFGKFGSKKIFYHDVFKIKFQKFIFLLLSSFPSDIICESDFEYLSIGALFFFFSIPNNLIRFTSILLFLSILDSNIKTTLKKFDLHFQKKIWKVLSLNYIKEISILGKIKILDINLNHSRNNYFLFKNRKIMRNSGLFIEDILISAKKNLNCLNVVQLNQKHFSMGMFCKNIFVLNYIIPCKSTWNKLFLADRLSEENFLIFFKDKKNYMTVCEFIFVLSLKLCFNCLKKKLNNFFNVFFYIQNYFLFYNVFEKKDCFLSGARYKKKIPLNYLIKLIAVMELISKKTNNFWKNLFLKSLTALFCWSRPPSNIKNINSNIEISKNFTSYFHSTFFLLSQSFLAFNIKEIYTEYKNLTRLSYNRVIIFSKRHINFRQKGFWGDSIVFGGSLVMVSKLLKKMPLHIFIISYFKLLNKFISFDININNLLFQSSFFSRDDLIKNYIVFYFFIMKKGLLMEILYLLFFFLIEHFFDKFTPSLNFNSVNKIFFRFMKIKKVFKCLKTLLCLNLFFKTQILSKKIQCISSINLSANKAPWNNLDIIVPYPSSITFYLSLILQTLRKRITCFEKMSLLYSIKEKDYLKVNNVFKTTTKSRSLFFENKHTVIFNFILKIKSLDRCNELFSKKGFRVFRKNVKNFLMVMNIFLNNQLDGKNWVPCKNIVLENEIKNKIIKINVSISDNKNFIDSLNFCSELHNFQYKKKIMGFIVNLPYKTILNKILS